MDGSMKVSLSITAIGFAVAVAGTTALIGPAACVVGGLVAVGYGLFGIDVDRGGGST